MIHWLILTGEYPPQPGGVSDYTRLVARSLAAAGDHVQVRAPGIAADDQPESGIDLRRLPDHFGPRGLLALGRELRGLPPETRLLVQYVPHAYGWKAMNILFCWWLWRRRRRTIIVMFHEVATPWKSQGSPRRRGLLLLLAAVTRGMAWLTARSARHIYISIPAWEKMLWPAVGNRPIEWLPVPSNVPLLAEEKSVLTRRRQLVNRRQFLVGHFGTFGGSIARILHTIFPELLSRHAGTVVLCIGDGSRAFVESCQARQAVDAERLLATGPLAAAEVSEHLSACDLLIQPYPDGISSRRGSIMAGLALGVPIVTTRGELTESIWEESGAVRLVDSPATMADVACGLLEAPEARTRLGEAARKLYRERFHLEHTITALRGGDLPTMLSTV